MKASETFVRIAILIAMIALIIMASSCNPAGYMVQDWKVDYAKRNPDSTVTLKLSKSGQPHPLPDSGMTGTYHTLIPVKIHN